MNKKGNSLWLGFALGLLAPVLFILIFYGIKFSDQYSFSVFLDKLFELNIASKYLSICVYPNLLLFFIFIWKNRLYSARGVLFATIILAILVFILKLSG